MLSLLSYNAFGMFVGESRPFRFSELISWMIVGLIAGAIAKILMPGKDPGGCAVTMLLGIGGAVLAGFLARHVLMIGDEGSWGGFFSRVGLGIVGALIILFIYRLIAGRRA